MRREGDGTLGDQRRRVRWTSRQVIVADTGEVHTVHVIASHDEWLDGLDDALRAEALHCLMTGTYSRALLASLRRDGPAISRRERGLDDPEKAHAGDPLGANLQTFLRERLVLQAPEPVRR